MDELSYEYEFMGGPQDGRTQTFHRAISPGLYVVFADGSEYQYHGLDSQFQFVGYREDLRPRLNEREVKLPWHDSGWWCIIAAVTLIGLAVWKTSEIAWGVVASVWNLLVA
jgi:hypothetical protein